jgi:pimeloyl-ACP methyl ester carboxylesterase
MARISVSLGLAWEVCVDREWLKGWVARPFDLGDGTTEVVVMGEGPPLLLLPPLPGYKEAWLGVARHLARRFRVVTFDQRAWFAGAPSWDVWLADLTRVADAFAPGPAFVMGHSLGGALAQRWTLAHPERVSALVLSSSFARVRTTRGGWRKRYLEQSLVLASQRWLPEGLAAPIARGLAARGRWVYDRRCDARTLAFVRQAIRRVPMDVARDCVHLAFAHDTRAKLRLITCPTLLVVGEYEASWSRAATDELSSLIPGATMRMSPGVAHLHLFSGARWFAETVDAWLEGLPQRGAAAATPAPPRRVTP